LHAKGTDLKEIEEKTCCDDQTGLGAQESKGNICGEPVLLRAGKAAC